MVYVESYIVRKDGGMQCCAVMQIKHGANDMVRIMFLPSVIVSHNMCIVGLWPCMQINTLNK